MSVTSPRRLHAANVGHKAMSEFRRNAQARNEDIRMWLLASYAGRLPMSDLATKELDEEWLACKRAHMNTAMVAPRTGRSLESSGSKLVTPSRMDKALRSKHAPHAEPKLAARP